MDKLEKWGQYETKSDKWKQFETQSQVSEQSFFEKTASNFFPNAMEVGQRFIDPKTYETLGDVSNLATPGGWLNLAIQSKNPVELAKSLGEGIYKDLSEKYGGWDNIKKTISEKPIDFLSDVATLFSGIGGVTGAGKIAKAGMAMEPLNLATTPMKGIKWLTGKTGLAERLYESSLKMSTKLSIDERRAIAKTGLENGILPNEKGFNQIQAKIDDINDDISNRIIGAARAGKTVDTASITSKLDDLYNDFYRYAPDTQYFRDILDSAKSVFEVSHGTTIPVDTAQKIKQTIYSLNRKAYGDLKGIQIESNKALARGLREEIERVHPEIKNLNAKEKALIELEDAIERAAKRIENRDIIGIGTTIATTAGTAATGSPVGGITAGLVRWAIDHPQMKAKIAIALQRARSKTWIRPKTTAGRLAVEQVEPQDVGP